MSKVLRIAGSLALLAFIAWRLDWSQFAEAFARVNYTLWAAGVAIYVLAQVVSALRWQLLSRPMGFDLGLGRYVSLYFIGMFFKLIDNLYSYTVKGSKVFKIFSMKID